MFSSAPRFLFAAVLSAATTYAASQPVTVKLADAKGESVGTATIAENPSGGVTITLDLKNLPPGEHAVHVHTTAKCEAPAFTTAAGHFNPAMKQHGKDNPMGAHAGDMNNFVVNQKGEAKLTFANPSVTLEQGANSLFANGGTALMIHAKGDDYKSDPAGAAGDRIACGVIIK